MLIFEEMIKKLVSSALPYRIYK